MAKPHLHAHHPPAREPRNPEAVQRRGQAAGAEAARGIQATADAFQRKVGVRTLKTEGVPSWKGR